MAQSILDNFPGPESIKKPADEAAGKDMFKELEKAKVVEKAKKVDKPTTVLGAAEDVAKSTGAGFGRGVASIPGLPGDISQLVQRSPAYGAWIAEQMNAGLQGRKSTAASDYQKKMAEVEAGMTPEEKAGETGQILGFNFPTSAKTIAAAEEYVPGLGYEPKTRAGKYGRTAGEFLGAGLPVTKPLSLAKMFVAPSKVAQPLAREAAEQIGAGVGSEAARQTFEGTKMEMPATIFGALPGAIFGKGAGARFAPGAATERGERIARDVIASTGITPDDLRIPPADLVPGVKPISPQILRDNPQLQGLAQRLERTEGNDVAALNRQRELSEESLFDAARMIPEEASFQRPFPSMSDALGLPNVQDPMIEASKRAHSAFRLVEEPLYNAQKNIWENPVFKNATYDAPSVKTAIDDAITQMGISYNGLPKEMKDYLNGLKKYKAGEIPFSEIQKTKQFANAMLRNPNVMDKSGAIALTTKLDDLLTDPKNLSANSAAQFPNAGDVFDQARRATREYHNLFSTKVTKPFSERHPTGHVEAGEYVMQPEQMLNKVFGDSKNGLAKYREFKSIPGINIDDAASDWFIGKLTNNGQKAFVTQDDVQKLLRDPNYAALVNEVPNLRSRLQDIASQSINEQVMTSFAQAMNNPTPDVLNKYIKQNRDVLNEAFPYPNQQNFIDQLDRSSAILSKIKPGAYTNDKLFNQLMNGDLFTLLHGKVTGKLASIVTGVAAGKIIGMSAFPAASLELLGGGAGAVGMLPKKTNSILSRIVHGTTQDEAVAALNRAMQDPAFMKFLMQKPTIENTMKLRNFMLKTLPATAAKSGFTGYRVGQDIQSLPPETTEESYQRLLKEGKIQPVRADGGRVARASGGQVSVDKGVRALMMAVEQAKKKVSQSTESLLEQPDEHIAQALSMAKRHI